MTKKPKPDKKPEKKPAKVKLRVVRDDDGYQREDFMHDLRKVTRLLDEKRDKNDDC